MDLSQKVQCEEPISISIILSVDEEFHTYQGPKSRGQHSQASNQPCLPLPALQELSSSPAWLLCVCALLCPCLYLQLSHHVYEKASAAAKDDCRRITRLRTHRVEST